MRSKEGMPAIGERKLFKEDSIRRRAEQIFNLRSDAGNKEIMEAFRRIVMKYHPDKNPNDRLSNQKMQLILQTYNLLMRRFTYGDSLNQYNLLEDDRLVKSVLPEGIELAPLGESYEEWHRMQFYEGFFF